MDEVHAIYENGVFRPTEPVNWPERSRVIIALEPKPETNSETATVVARVPLDEVDEVLLRRFRSGHVDTAARHNEHQP